MKLLINGTWHEFPDNLPLNQLLTRLAGERRDIAVALNREFVPRSRYDEYQLKPGDEIEILSPIQGG